uniref:transketolase C-terminal domain-containing protein n=2 Tax=Microbacteriaceae TaxID=85023 RepID=UPI00292FDE0D
IEDGIRVGGIGTRIRQVLREAGIDTAVDELGLPDEFIDHAERYEILDDAGLTSAKIAHDVVAQVLGTRIPIARPSADAATDWADAADAPGRAGASDGEPQPRGR